MERFQDRSAGLGRSLTELAAYAAGIGGLSLIINLGSAFKGEAPAIGRIVLGVVGIAAGMLLWTERRLGIDGWQAVMPRPLPQTTFYAGNTDCSPTVHIVEIPLPATSKATVNGEITPYGANGINQIGVIPAIWVTRTRERWERRAGPAVTTM